jgi:hypothetical protein
MSAVGAAFPGAGEEPVMAGRYILAHLSCADGCAGQAARPLA